jgi:dihydrofolate reductase
MKTERLPLCMIAAYSENRVIGNNNQLPWHIPEDAKFFRQTTLGHAIIMGRKTFESVGKPLPKRRNIVVSRTAGWLAPGAEVVPTLEQAIALARETDPEPFIVGGSYFYQQGLPLATKLYLTEVAQVVEGDAFFPTFDEAEWHEINRQPGDGFVIRTLVRRSE